MSFIVRGEEEFLEDVEKNTKKQRVVLVDGFDSMSYKVLQKIADFIGSGKSGKAGVYGIVMLVIALTVILRGI